MPFASLKLEKPSEYHHQQDKLENKRAKRRLWALATVGTIVVLAIVGYLVYFELENSRWTRVTARITSHAHKGADVYHILYSYSTQGSSYTGEAVLPLAPGTNYVEVVYSKNDPAINKIAPQNKRTLADLLQKAMIAGILGGFSGPSRSSSALSQCSMALETRRTNRTRKLRMSQSH